jgi:hypothetical protein
MYAHTHTRQRHVCTCMYESTNDAEECRHHQADLLWRSASSILSCIYIYIYIYIHTHTHTYIHTHTQPKRRVQGSARQFAATYICSNVKKKSFSPSEQACTTVFVLGILRYTSYWKLARRVFMARVRRFVYRNMHVKVCNFCTLMKVNMHTHRALRR